MKKDAAETKAYIDAQQAEERKLLKIIQEADAERSRQKKQLEQVRLRINKPTFLISKKIQLNSKKQLGNPRERYIRHPIGQKKRRVSIAI
jgi:hypothetical protein